MWGSKKQKTNIYAPYSLTIVTLYIDGTQPVELYHAIIYKKNTEPMLRNLKVYYQS